jgi:hypothetical protein
LISLASTPNPSARTRGRNTRSTKSKVGASGLWVPPTMTSSLRAPAPHKAGSSV